MDSRTAIHNNVAWYVSMLRAHGIEGEVNEHHWTTDAAVPPYYSNLVTTSTDDAVQLARIRRLSELHDDWSLKDSFARLQTDLRVLFEAHWFVAEVDAEPELPFTRIRTAAELELWEQAWRRTSPTAPRRMFPGSLLADPDVALFTAPVGGVALNLSAGAVGLTNFFTTGDPDAFLNDCARMARRLHPDRAVVGYCRDPAASGLRALGPLRVIVARP